MANSNQLVSFITGVIFGITSPVTAGIDAATPGQAMLFDSTVAPFVVCLSTDMNSVTFAWTDVNDVVGYYYNINQEQFSDTVFTIDTLLFIDNLEGGSVVTIAIWNVGVLPLPNSDTVFVSCITDTCEAVDIIIIHPEIKCSDDEPFQLEVSFGERLNNPIISWSGPAIIDPSGIFDPSVGSDKVMVTVQENGCIYSAFRHITVLEKPLASFEVVGSPCIDSTLQLFFNGYAYYSADWHWNFDGANTRIIDIINRPVDFDFKWDQPGDYLLSLFIDYHGCFSDTFYYPIQIDPLPQPILASCTSDYFSLIVNWEPVEGATEYIVDPSLGEGQLSGNTYTITQLPDDTSVDINLIAAGSACGHSSLQIQCKTLDYIPAEVFNGNIFSPNNDGINDVFFIQSNSPVQTVKTFRIFNRWGNLIFENLQFAPNDPTQGWDGRFKEKPVNPGVYVYEVIVESIYGDMINLKGDVTLVR